MKAGLYLRVSTEQQAQGTSLETQEAECRAEAVRLGFQVLEEAVVHEHYSGAYRERPGLSQLQAMARSGAIDAVVAHAPDRLSREPLDLLLIVGSFADSDVEVIFVHGLSENTDEGRLMTYVQGFAAQQERKRISERSMRGKEAVARGGRIPNGTGPGLFGYDYDPLTKKRTVKDEEAVVVRLIFQWAGEGVNRNQIAKRLNQLGYRTKRGFLWDASGVTRLLKNQAYTGVQRYGEKRYRSLGGGRRSVTKRAEGEVITVEGFTPPIISQAVFGLVQEKMGVGQARVTGAPARYLLTGFVRCAECGGRVSGSMLARKHRYYRCRATSPRASRPATCHARYIPAEDFEFQVLGIVLDALMDPAVLVSELHQHFATGGGNLGEEMKGLRREIQDLKGQQLRLIEMRQKDAIAQDLLESKIAPLKVLTDEKQGSLDSLEAQQRLHDGADQMEQRVVAMCKQFSERLGSLDFDGTRALLSAFGVKVVAVKGDLSVTMVVDPAVAALNMGRSGGDDGEDVTTIGRTSASLHECSRPNWWVSALRDWMTKLFPGPLGPAPAPRALLAGSGS